MSDILEELESSLSRIGADKLYKRVVGGHLLWFAPVTLEGQERITELMSSANTMGINIIHETKRTTLANSIVGIDAVDLRKYRDATPVLTITNGGQKLKVSLEKFLYTKIGQWSSQFVDDAFTVFADVVETDQKDNLKDVKFDNVKLPMEEHDELLKKIQKLRSDMNMPPLIDPIIGTSDSNADNFQDPELEMINPFAPINNAVKAAKEAMGNAVSVDIGDLADTPSDVKETTNPRYSR